MGWKSTLIKPYAGIISRQVEKMAANAVHDQRAIFRYLVRQLRQTAFGSDHNAGAIKTYEDYTRYIPIRGYEDLKPYIDRIIEGESSVLWPGRPKYFAKTSGTTSGVKYIPITKQSIPNHFGTARNALFHYAVQSGNFSFIDGKMIFLSGSPELDQKGGIPTGRLSGIVNHFVPAWLRTNQMPTYETNCIEDWEPKLDKIVEETLKKDMRLISGIPPWVQMYYERLLECTGESSVKEIFPNFSVFVYGGVNYEPYRDAIEQLTGPGIQSIETYPASEGFIAFQDRPRHEGLLLNTRSGIYYEFVATEGNKDIMELPRLTLSEVETGKNYALIISSNAGLWAYNIGDTIEFLSTDPYRIKVSGRLKHFISAFGEHVIGKEVEESMAHATNEAGAIVTEFTVAPQIHPQGGAPYHEWFVEFERVPDNIRDFAKALDTALQKQNIYYEDLRKGNILSTAIVRVVRKGGFRAMMKARGKLGGQNKVPRLSNDRKLAEELNPYLS
jgi:hypothetical protein